MPPSIDTRRKIQGRGARKGAGSSARDHAKDDVDEQEKRESEQEKLACRICYGDEPDGLISPCACKGSMAAVHEACLLEWVKRSAAAKAAGGDGGASERSLLQCGDCLEMYEVLEVVGAYQDNASGNEAMTIVSGLSSSWLSDFKEFFQSLQGQDRRDAVMCYVQYLIVVIPTLLTAGVSVLYVLLFFVNWYVDGPGPLLLTKDVVTREASGEGK